MKRFLALMLSVLLLLSPLAGLADQSLSTRDFLDLLKQKLKAADGIDYRSFSVTLSMPEKETHSFGVSKLANGSTCAYADFAGVQLMLTRSAAYLVDGETVVSADSDALLQAMLDEAESVGLGLADLKVVRTVLQDAFAALNGNVLQLSKGSRRLEVNADLPKLLQNVKLVLNNAANQHAKQLNSMLAKLAKLLPGMPASCQEVRKLIVWPVLSGKSTTDVTVLSQKDAYSVQGTLGKLSFTTDVRKDDFSFDLTMKDGSGEAVRLALSFTPEQVFAPENPAAVSADEFVTQMKRVFEEHFDLQEFIDSALALIK